MKRTMFLLSFCLLFLTCMECRATTVLYSFQLTGYDATRDLTERANFTLEVDPSLQYTNATTGLSSTLFTYNFPVIVPFAFDFYQGVIFIGSPTNSVATFAFFDDDFFINLQLPDPVYPLAHNTHFDTFEIAGKNGIVFQATSLSMTYSLTTTNPPPVPEPASLALMGTGVLGVIARARHLRKNFADSV